MTSSDALFTVRKNQDQAGLATRFRTERPSVSSIPTVDAEQLPLDAFQSNYVLQDRNLPVRVRGALTQEWKCITAWDSGYLKQTVGHAELLVRVNPSEDGTFGDVGRLSEHQVSLYDFNSLRFDAILDGMNEHPPQYYPARVELCEDLPELIPDVPSFYDLPWRFAFGCPYKNGCTAYFGPGRQTTPLHYDTLENLTFMVSGSKTFKLYPPVVSSHLSPAPRSLGTHYSLLSPQAAAESAIASLDVTLHKGDMLYLPTCWWHSVHGGDGFNISLNYWFCQHCAKEDYTAYRSYLTASFENTLKQLQSMGLPQSVLEEAERDAFATIESKINQRKQFEWKSEIHECHP